ncbi:MAG: endopeptidase La [Acidobacteria bacterium]|nr:endopeptidase La [Acidobacteriota bacterium]
MGSLELDRLPMVPLREAVVFPRTMVPFVVGRQSSLKALDRVLQGPDRRIFLACQRDAAVDEPREEEVHSIGTIATIVQSLKVASGNIRILVEGISRARALGVERTDEGFFIAEVATLADRAAPGNELEELGRQALTLFEEYVKQNPALPAETLLSTLKVTEPGRVADTIAAHLLVPAEVKQDLLERFVVRERLERLVRVIEMEIDKLRVDQRVNSRVKQQLERAQREYYLSEKIKAIQQELGRGLKENDLEVLAARIDGAGMPAEAKDKAQAELRRLEAMPPVSAEATVSRTYLDWLLAVPWSARSAEKRDLKRARRILEEDHHGLEEVKERILEHLAVRRLAPGSRQHTILCFVGPPGVGKTSLARSIARATGRKFVRVSLGGVRDEAEIRGHRRTYIGALPGRVIQMMRKAGTKNPVFLLDELDKMSTDFRGDPSAALLEVLDPEQNHAFQDHYLEVDYDLSEVFFIATANVLHTVPPALQDRLETIHLPGYTLAEKLAIGERFLVPKQVVANGFKPRQVRFPRASLQDVVERYTREAGVRQLEREISRACRKLARQLVDREWSGHVEVDPEKLAALLGVPRFRVAGNRRENEVGVATGLAWTAVGGELIVPEVSVVPGRGQLMITGQVGGVMQESANAALTYVRSRAAELGIDTAFYRRRDIHIHVPEGAIPKDGPSAGIALATALVSFLAGIPARADVAMTGEITLRGRVLPVGGIKQKILAAHRCGIRAVILPRENEKDLGEIPADVLAGLEICLVDHMDEVLPRALERAPAAVPLVEQDNEIPPVRAN